MLLAFEHKACQSTRHIGAGVDVDPVRQHFGPVGRSMAMNDALAEVYFAIEKLLSDPQQILGILPIEGDAGPDTGMTQEVRSGARTCSQ